jgi:hypothetical protein
MTGMIALSLADELFGCESTGCCLSEPAIFEDAPGSDRGDRLAVWRLSLSSQVNRASTTPIVSLQAIVDGATTPAGFSQIGAS